MSYPAGFDAGERAAFAHRSEATRLMRPQALASDYARGFWDGYCTRSPEWSAARRNAVESDEEATQGETN